MNILPCEVRDGSARFAGRAVATANAPGAAVGRGGGRAELGVRPEFVRFAADGIPVVVARVADAGRHRIVEARAGDTPIRLLLGEREPVPSEPRVGFDPRFTHLYVDGWLAGEGAA
jgi:glycerol transport system ATP-binding protein